MPSTDSLALLRLLQLSSAALPVGAYAYSHGLEYAVASGIVHDWPSAADWISGVAEHSVAPLDVAVLARLHRAFSSGDAAGVGRWNEFLCAARETHELAQEDRHMGLALARLLLDLGLEQAAPYRGADEVAYVTLFAMAAVHWGIGVREAQHALLYSFCENQVAAAIKLVPLGQTDGQRLLGHAIERIGSWVDAARALPDEDVGPLSPGLALASARHERQYSRLFRS